MSKLDRARIIEKLGEFEKIKLKRYVDYRLKKYRLAFLNKDKRKNYLSQHDKIGDAITKKLQDGEVEEHKRLIWEFSKMAGNE